MSEDERVPASRSQGEAIIVRWITAVAPLTDRQTPPSLSPISQPRFMFTLPFTPAHRYVQQMATSVFSAHK